MCNLTNSECANAIYAPPAVESGTEAQVVVKFENAGVSDQLFGRAGAVFHCTLE